MTPVTPAGRGFRHAVMASLHWSALGRFASQLFTWVITILVIRLLDPADYGLMALGWMFIGIFAAFEGIGLTAALIQKQDLAERQVRRLFAAVLVAGVVLYGFAWLAAPLVAGFFDETELVLLIRVLGVTIPLAALGALPLALIQRELRFKQKSAVEFVAAVSGAVLTFAMAATGFGVWSLVGGILCLTAVQSTGYWLAHRRLYVPDFDLRGIRREFGFGGLVTLDRLTWLVYSQADIFFVGKFLGKDALGIYAVAMQLASLPMKRVVGFLNEVGFSAFSKIQQDRDEVARALRTAVRNLALVSFPFFFGLAAIAPLVIDLFLDDKWASTALPLTLLALVVPLRLINTVTPTVLFSLGRAELALQNGVLALLLFAPAFAFAAQRGDVIDVCLVWLWLYPLYYLVCLVRALPVTGVSLGTYLYELLPFAGSAILMFALVSLAVGGMAGAGVAVLPNLALGILLGVLVYVGMLWILARERLFEFLRLVRN